MKIKTTSNVRMSAILPNYNDCELLPQAIESLLNQSDAFDEIILIDDASTDDSLAVIQPYLQAHKQIRLVQHKKNQGVCRSLNHGIKQAQGDYVILCAADDRYQANIVALAKEAVRAFPSVGLVCGNAIVKRFDKKQSFLRMLPYPQKNTYISPDEFRTCANQHYVGFNGGGGMFMNRAAILKAGLLFPELRWHCDWLLYYVIAFEKGFYYCDEVFVHIHMRKHSYSEGKKQWPLQRQVILDSLRIIDHRYPNLWQDFKRAALLPCYSLRYLSLLPTSVHLRRFFTFNLLWKLIINNMMVVRVGRLFPYRIILQMRKLLRA